MTTIRSGSPGTSRRASRLRKATALVPLALLSAAWTANIVGVGSPVALAGDQTHGTLPDGTSVPAQAIEAPASVTTGDSLGLGVGNADAQQIVSTSSTSGIPSAALAAYQRAQTVMNAADQSCHLPWQLVAAIGRVESNHGRADGNVLDDAGIAEPGIYGVPLNGQGGTQAVVDSDAGQYDNDTSFDRAVGPMQFIPSTWSVVGVDADGDGVRNPQDINDAALAAAVYLCSGSDDLSTASGERAAVYRYNHSESYVDLVLAIAQAYTDGDFTTIPNGTVLAGEMARYPTPAVPSSAPAHGQKLIHRGPDQTSSSAAPSPSATPSPTSRPSPTSEPSPSSKSSPSSKPSSQSTPTKKPSVLPSVSLPPVPSTSITPIDQALTLAQATAQCLADGVSQLDLQGFNACLDKYMHPNG